MNTYDAFHLAMISILEKAIWFMMAVLVLTGLTLLVAWINDRYQARDHRRVLEPEALEDAPQCCFGAGRPPRCEKLAEWVSCFHGQPCKGVHGYLAWCDEHKPTDQQPPHSVQPISFLNPKT